MVNNRKPRRRSTIGNNSKPRRHSTTGNNTKLRGRGTTPKNREPHRRSTMTNNRMPSDHRNQVAMGAMVKATNRKGTAKADISTATKKVSENYIIMMQRDA